MKTLIGLLVVAGLCLSAQEPAGPTAPKTPPRAERSAEVASGAAERNENVFIVRVDTNAVREALTRLGAAATVLEAPLASRNYFGGEHGKAPSEPVFLSKMADGRAGWHATMFEEHRNSVFNSRTFFQVGPVKPSRSNHYGFTLGGPGGGWFKNSFFLLDAGQRKVRGMVNGNVLAPLASERTPLTQDPALRPIVARMLAAYGPELPNRPDQDTRALNTNSPQVLNEDRALLGVERALGSSRVNARYSWNTRKIHAFQFVAGQNPETTLRSHQARLSLERPVLRGTLSLGVGFDRLHSLLLPEPNAFGPRVAVGSALTELGPGSQFPMDRSENTFRFSGQVLLPRGSHRWMAGSDLARFQFSGRDTQNSRGFFSFARDAEHTAIDTLRMGRPTSFDIALGDFTRGFRNLEWNAYFGDTWRVNPRLQLVYGIRYNLRTAPHEVNNRTQIPFRCDCNNFSPRFSFAYRAGRGAGAYGVIRGYYTVSYGEIYGVTYQQARFNPPQVQYVQVQFPSLLDPLAGLAGSGRSAFMVLDPGLVSPYAHQYGLVLQRDFQGAWNLQLAYLGSRSFKLLTPWITNRGQPVSGIPLSTATINRRRADLTRYEVARVLNMAIGYFDAGQVSVNVPYKRGLALSAAYTFSKAIDTGYDYTGTAAQSFLNSARPQSEFYLIEDKRGLSDFDVPHSFLVQYSYDLPLPSGWRGLARKLFGGWQVSGATLFKKGTPFTLYTGSDSPGFGNVDGVGGDRPNVVDPAVLGRTIGDPDTSQSLLPRSAFSFVRPGELRGNVGRNVHRKGGINNWNLSLGRSWKLPLGGEGNLAFRAEVLNLTNRPQFDAPEKDLSTDSFGRISNTLNDGRIVQFVLRLRL